MSDLDALLAGIVAHSHEPVRWLIVADWLDDHGQPERAELLRLHRELIRTCCEPDQHPERAAWQARIVELIDQGVTPCVPQHTLMLPGGVPLVGNFIPPGSFLMGSEETEDENPVHKVTITKGFFMGICPVTQSQWVAAIGKGTNPSEFVGLHRPVDRVTLRDVVDFCTSSSKQIRSSIQLPTEVQWEYACRAGTTTAFHYGADPDPTRMRCLANDTCETVSYPSNPWGLFDCHGNVWERCADTFLPDLADGRPSTHIAQYCRGGSWEETPVNCKSDIRSWFWGDYRHDMVGFRVVFTLS
jgi:uncharacterized protein (TIGR02996 family)